MADKKKVSVEDDRGAAGGGVLEGDRQFLERNSVGSLMKEAIESLISNRPEDPINALVSFFESAEKKRSAVEHAFQILTSSSHKRPMFERNVRLAYTALSHYKVSKHLHGVTGVVYRELMLQLCKDFSQPVTSCFLRKIECLDTEAVPYEVFRYAIFCYCSVKDFLELAGHLFSLLDKENTGKADKLLCDVLLEQLKSALVISANNPECLLEASYNISPEKLEPLLEKALNSEANHEIKTSKETFVLATFKHFVSKIQHIR